MFFAYHFFVFSQNQVICAESNAKDDGCHSFKAMNPLLSLRPLTTNIKHSARKKKTPHHYCGLGGQTFRVANIHLQCSSTETNSNFEVSHCCIFRQSVSSWRCSRPHSLDSLQRHEWEIREFLQNQHTNFSRALSSLYLYVW